MTKLYYILLIFFINAGCATGGNIQDDSNTGTTDGKGSTEFNNHYAERVMPKEIREALGLKPGDLVIATTSEGNILFVAEDLKTAPAKHAPFGKTLYNEFRVIVTKDSPRCGWYIDGWGNQKDYPVPDCPHPNR